MKKILIIILMFGIQGCKESSDNGPNVGPSENPTETKSYKESKVKAVCYKNGEVVLDDTSIVQEGENPNEIYLNSDESVDVDNCSFTYYE